MKTNLNTNHVLSDEKKAKVCMITEVNKAAQILLGRNINTEEFDILYDKDLHAINEIIRRLNEAIRFRMKIINLAHELFEISKAARR